MKKLISLLLALLLLLPFGLSAAAEAPAETPAPVEYTEISDLDGLLAIAADPSGSYILTADIDMAGKDWKPIPFCGTLDGAGHTLYNMKIHEVGDDQRVTRDGNLKAYDTVFAGLFSVMENATVRDLRITGAEIEIEGLGHCFVGILAGYMYGCSVQGCSVQGRARLNNYAVQTGIGGLVGYGAGDFGFCRADVELILEDRNLDSRCEQFMGGILACGLANIEDCSVTIDGYDSCHGYVHNGGLCGMYYYCGMNVHSQSVRRNKIVGQISFFEDNPNRRAYCEATLGEEMSVPGNYYSNEVDEFVRNETRDYSQVLLPEKCESPEIHFTLTPPTCDEWGFVYNECAGCGYHWVDSYFPPQHTPGEWELVESATAEHDGLRERRCAVCGALLDTESVAYVPPEPLYREEEITVEGLESIEALGVRYRGQEQAMHSEAASGPLTWSSDDPEIVSVDPNGVVTGLQRGVGTVRYSSEDGLYTGVCTVTVYYTFWQWLLILFLFGWLWYV